MNEYVGAHSCSLCSAASCSSLLCHIFPQTHTLEESISSLRRCSVRSAPAPSSGLACHWPSAFHCGAMPIEIAAGHGRRKDVELLFPFTSPIQSVSKWTVEGIIAHVKSKRSKHSSKHKVGRYNKSTSVGLKLGGDKTVGRKDYLAASKPYSEVEQYGKGTKDKLKLDGDKAVGRKDYIAASKLYGEAIELDPTDATLYSNRSFCHLRIGEATKALSDANSCIKMRPEWLKGYYRKGAALMSLKEYKEACDAFMAGFKLDPANADMEKMLREAVEAMKKDHVGVKNLESID